MHRRLIHDRHHKYDRRFGRGIDRRDRRLTGGFGRRCWRDQRGSRGQRECFRRGIHVV
ncbi:MAG TPA: hypothetical protein VFA26_17420 [Gemmataceae bacterium]|nr:hypothetical protein [Gemmataceae bacterium]